MNLILILVGILVIVVTIYDVVITVLSHMGAGPITDFWTKQCWRFFLKLKYSNNFELPIRYSGPLFLVGIISVWYLLFYVGWFCLIYAGDYTLRGKPGANADPLEIIYFIGSTFSTLGIGDITPTRFPWTLITTFGALTVSLLTSLAVSYIIPVLRAVVERRNIVSLIQVIGLNPRDILARAWTGEYAGSLDSTVQALPEKLISASYQTHLYPVLEFFYFENSRYSLSGSIVNILDALIVQLTKPEREGNLQPPRLMYMFDGIEIYIKNVCQNRTSAELNLKVDHLDLFKLLEEYECSYKSYLGLDRFLNMRRSLLIFSHYEGGCRPDENGVIQSIIQENGSSAGDECCVFPSGE